MSIDMHDVIENFRCMPASTRRLDRLYLRVLFDVMLLQQAVCVEHVLVDLFFETPAERRPDQCESKLK
jgi:hypothetical protein